MKGKKCKIDLKNRKWFPIGKWRENIWKLDFSEYILI